ncbi:MAG: UDP-N-acetylmuramate dehydrogenase [Pseudomonadota bacterium]
MIAIDQGDSQPEGSSQSPRGEWRVAEPMAKHSSWRVGGSAAHYFEPADRGDLVAMIQHGQMPLPLTFVGLGSNILVRNGGIEGTVISTARGLAAIEINDDETLSVECGAPCARVAKTMAEHGLDGGEFLIGIPGTIGGALSMNAGAFGSETWDLVDEVEMLDQTGHVIRLAKSYFDISYRKVKFPMRGWFLGAHLSAAQQKAPSEAKQRIRELLKLRSSTQPVGTANCGSVFKNPPEDFAGRLIEQAGLKGMRIGGCVVSEKHANFFINDEHADANDIEQLVIAVREAVEEKFGIRLEPEVQIIGNRSEDGS